MSQAMKTMIALRRTSTAVPIGEEQHRECMGLPAPSHPSGADVLEAVGGRAPGHGPRGRARRTGRSACRRAAALGCRPRCGGRRHRARAGPRRSCCRGRAWRPTRPGCMRGVRRSRWASTMAPRAAVMSSAEATSKIQTYWPKISSASPVDVARVVVGSRPSLSMPVCTALLVEDDLAEREDEHAGEADDEEQGGPALALDRLDDRVGRVDADEHEDEEEEHHHGAGVDEHLHDRRGSRPSA